MITIVDVRNRVMELCERITLPSPYGTGKAYRDESECSWKSSDLPAYVVEDSGRGSEYQYADSYTSYHTQDTLRIILYLSHISDESYKKDLDSIDLASVCKQTILQYFAAKRGLAIDNTRDLVESAIITRASSPHTYMTTGSKPKNRVIVFTMLVRYLNFAPQTDE
jgi:hypothetical protein